MRRKVVHARDLRVSGSFGTYLQTRIVASNSHGSTTSTQSYDVRDQLTNTSSNGNIVTNNDGLIVDSGSSASQPGSLYIYQGDQLLGNWQYPSSGTGAMTADFGYNFTPISDSYPAVAPGSTVVNSGDTLKSIAQQIYGDASLWYVIADANGIQGNGGAAGTTGSGFVVGQVLTLPNQVINSNNTATTFRPYDASRILGNQNPPAPLPPPANHHCNVLATIVIAAVAVIATIVTTGVAAGALGVTQATIGGVTTSTTLGIGAAALGGGSLADAGIGTVLTAAAAGGAAGSIASQLTGDALGVSNGFSFAAVAAGALGAAATAGIGSAFPGTSFGNDLIQSGLDDAARQGIGVALGQQSHFSWSEVAASALVGGTTQGTSGFNLNVPALNGGVVASLGVLGTAAEGTLAGIAQTGIGIVLGGHGKLDVATVAADSFGNAIGNSIVGAIETTAPEKPEPLSDAESFQYNQYLNSSDNLTPGALLTPDQIAFENTVPADPLSEAESYQYNQYLSSQDPGSHDSVLTPDQIAFENGNVGAPVTAVAGGSTAAKALASAAGAQALNAQQAPGYYLSSQFLNDSATEVAAINQIASSDIVQIGGQDALDLAALQAQNSQGLFANALSGAASQGNDLFVGGAEILGRTAEANLQVPAGIVAGVASSLFKAVNAGVNIVADTTLQIGDILTGGYNHDSEIIQQALVEQGQLGAGVARLFNDPAGVFNDIVNGTSGQVKLANNLAAGGNYFGAALVDSELATDAGTALLGGARAAIGLTRAGVAGLSLIDSAAIRNFALDETGSLTLSPSPGSALTTYYPGNRGFLGEPAPFTLLPGATIDRYGFPGGFYAAPEGTSFAARALPADAATKPLLAYEVVKPIDVNAGRAAPAFDQIGLGTQYEFHRPIQYYLDNGYLKQK